MSPTHKQSILVTGGAGYIGSHACKALKNAGYQPVTYDNLSTGWADAVRFGPLERGELCDANRLHEVFAKYAPMAVMHFGALSDVGQSMREPGRYWHNNVAGSLALINAMVGAGCRKMVFSSTCATYGEQDHVVLDETCAQMPINAYGGSKLAIEQMLANFAVSDGLESVIFRYFNVAGADSEAEIGEFHRPETHLVPLILDAVMGRRDRFTIYGDDYATPDGTCIRDYVHVSDLVDAHMTGLDRLMAGKGSRVFNLGTGRGFSVKEVLAETRVITNHAVPVQTGARRAGDCTKLVSGSRRAQKELGWNPRRSTLARMIEDAWQWHQQDGYKS